MPVVLGRLVTVPNGSLFMTVTLSLLPSNSAETLAPMADSPSSTIRSKCPPIAVDSSSPAAVAVGDFAPSSYRSARMCSEPLRFSARVMLSREKPGKVATTVKRSVELASTDIRHPTG